MRIFFLLTLLLPAGLLAQGKPYDSSRNRGDEWVVVNGDTVRVIELDEVLRRERYDSMARVEYMRLVRNVKRAMPYAKMVAYQMQMLEDNLSRTKGRKERKKYIEASEEALKKQFEASIRELSINQGKILMKLIHRETGKTTWEVLKGYKGNASAFFWQSFGTFWGHDLKSEFDPVTDYKIEFIIRTYKLE
ncbi:MAG: DUF4294 domain-containing protein [Bacteroidota bacterium]|jgi:hypothetical protein